jgi:hypothetical protein
MLARRYWRLVMLAPVLVIILKELEKPDEEKEENVSYQVNRA